MSILTLTDSSPSTPKDEDLTHRVPRSSSHTPFNGIDPGKLPLHYLSPSSTPQQGERIPPTHITLLRRNPNPSGRENENNWSDQPSTPPRRYTSPESKHSNILMPMDPGAANAQSARPGKDTMSGQTSGRSSQRDDRSRSGSVKPSTSGDNVDFAYEYVPVIQRKEGREHIKYELSMRQQPVQARMCGVGEKSDRRPVDPTPIIQLKVIDEQGEGSSTGAGSHLRRPESGPNGMTFMQNPYYFLFACLVGGEEQEDELHVIDDGKTRFLTGTPVSSLYHLKDLDNSDAAFFVFPDLGVRKEGKYRLKLTLFEIVDQEVFYCTTSFTDTFSVYSAKKFPGMQRATDLSKSFADQGLKIRVRKDPRKQSLKSKRKSSANESESEGANDSYSKKARQSTGHPHPGPDPRMANIHPSQYSQYGPPDGYYGYQHVPGRPMPPPPVPYDPYRSSQPGPYHQGGPPPSYPPHYGGRPISSHGPESASRRHHQSMPPSAHGRIEHPAAYHQHRDQERSRYHPSVYDSPNYHPSHGPPSVPWPQQDRPLSSRHHPHLSQSSIPPALSGRDGHYGRSPPESPSVLSPTHRPQEHQRPYSHHGRVLSPQRSRPGSAGPFPGNSSASIRRAFSPGHRSTRSSQIDQLPAFGPPPPTSAPMHAGTGADFGPPPVRSPSPERHRSKRSRSSHPHVSSQHSLAGKGTGRENGADVVATHDSGRSSTTGKKSSSNQDSPATTPGGTNSTNRMGLGHLMD